MDHLEHLNRITCLVALEVADEVPVDIARQLRDFRLRFLYAIFAKASQARVVRFMDRGRWKSLRDGKQEHIRRLAPRSFRSTGETGLHAHDVVSETGHA